MTNPTKGTKPRSGPESLPATTAAPIEQLIRSRSKLPTIQVDGVREYVIDVDVDLATQMLAARHPDQRGLRPTPLARLVADMRATPSRYVWEAVDVMRFNTFGQLIDGQHRLEALRRANAELENGHKLVLRNVRVFFLASDGRLAMTVFDGGANRTMPEALKMSGQFTDLIIEKIPARVVNAVVFAEANFMPETAREYSRTVVVDILFNANRSALNRLIEIAGASTVSLTRGHLAAAYVCMAKSTTPDLAYKFFQAAFQNVHSIDERPSKALQALCNQLIRDRDKAKGVFRGEYSVDAARAHRCIVFYNSWREGDHVRRIQFHGKVTEPV